MQAHLNLRRAFTTPARHVQQQQQQQQQQRRLTSRLCCTAATSEDVDVVVVGAGIIGLCISHRLLKSTNLSVAVVDRKQPCAGATGAGQGYIWQAHRQPMTAGWDLAQRSKCLWEDMAAEDGQLAAAMEWQANGSVLLATSPDEVVQLEARAAMLTQQGIKGVRLMAREALLREEPALTLPRGSAGLLVATDAQLNGRATAFALLRTCKQLGSGGRFQAMLDEPVEQVLPSSDDRGGMGHSSCSGPVVVTSGRRLRARQAVIIAAGVWTGALLAECTGQEGWRHLLQPRRGHLLELQPSYGLPVLRHGHMELSYTRHYNHDHVSSNESTSGSSDGSSSAQHASDEVDITFTATTSASGSLLLGSSREFGGWDSNGKRSVIAAILERARLFLPGIPDAAHADARVGLRPFAEGGLPFVGPVPGAPGVFVAAGHEGSGLCMGPATAELVLSCALAPRATHNPAVVTAVDQLLPCKRLAVPQQPAIQ